MNTLIIILIIIIWIAIISCIVAINDGKKAREVLKHQLNYANTTEERMEGCRKHEAKMGSIHLERAMKAESRVECIRKEYDMQRELRIRAESENQALVGVLNKLLDQQCDRTDSIFVFEGKCYKVTGTTLNRDEDSEETLDVSCVRIHIDEEH